MKENAHIHAMHWTFLCSLAFRPTFLSTHLKGNLEHFIEFRDSKLWDVNNTVRNTQDIKTNFNRYMVKKSLQIRKITKIRVHILVYLYYCLFKSSRKIWQYNYSNLEGKIVPRLFPYSPYYKFPPIIHVLPLLSPILFMCHSLLNHTRTLPYFLPKIWKNRSSFEKIVRMQIMSVICKFAKYGNRYRIITQRSIKTKLFFKMKKQKGNSSQ